MVRTIQIVNKTSILTADDIQPVLDAIQTQIDRDFSPAWGVSANLVLVPDYDPSQESIILLDDPTVAGALGFHEVAPGTEIPRGYVFVKTALQALVPPSSVLSHEVLEQLADSFAYAAAIGTFGGRPAAIILEPADATETDTYSINGVAVSNFVFPAWFDEQTPHGARFDQMDLLHEPCTLRPGGFISVSYNLRTWREITHYKGAKSAYRAHAGVHRFSRPVRRLKRTLFKIPA